MKRLLLVIVLIVAGLLPMTASAYPISRWAVIASTPPQPALTQSYRFYTIAGHQVQHVFYQVARTRPRSFGTGEMFPGSRQIVTNPASYAGYDLFDPRQAIINFRHIRDDAIQLKLNRPACVGVVWLSDVVRTGWSASVMTKPTWLSGYTQGENVAISWPKSETDPAFGWTTFSAPTYWTAATAGTWTGGAIVNPGQTMATSRLGYWLLLAERGADGACSPTPSPAVPADSVVPLVGQPCPAWLHDRHTDGTYAVWHPQIDPVYWCNYGEDHGADPDLNPAIASPFGIVGRVHGMTEAHFGFKLAVFDVPANGGLPAMRVTVNVHQGTTAGVSAACVRFHEFHIGAVAKDTGEVMFRYRLMADFGPGVNAATGAFLVPESCPNQGIDAWNDGARYSRKQFPVIADQPRGGYEPWSIDFRRTGVALGLGVPNGPFVVNTFDPVKMVTITGQAGGPYAENYPTSNSGTGVFLQIGNFAITPPFTGSRWTDPLGRTILPSTDPMAIEQYVSPRMAGKTWTIPYNKCSSSGFGVLWNCISAVNDENPPAEREDSIPVGGPN